jgi:murein DD-endopeptidase MepM/ murein hydrolase activator NlpD
MIITSIKTKLKATCLIAFTAFAISLVPTAAQATADHYFYPINPYSVGGYGFGQYVAGTAGYHAGHDVAAGAGAAVYATAEGVVTYSARTPDSYRWGNLVMIEHTNPDGSKAVSLYGHLSNDRRVAAGQIIPAGTLVGFVGPSYTAENGNWAAHLHFQIKYGGYSTGIGQYAAEMSGYVSASGLGIFANPQGYVLARNSISPPQPTKVWDHQGVSASGSGTYGKNQIYEVEFKTKNTGNQTWSKGGANPVRLATTLPNDRGSSFSNGMGGRGWLSPNRIEMVADTPPGGIATFKAVFNNAIIPPGYYEEFFTPVVEGVGFMRNQGLGVGVRVNPSSYGAQWVGQSFNAHHNPTDRSLPTDADYLAPGRRVGAKAYIRNTGDIPWKSTGANPVRLGTSQPFDRLSGFAIQGDGSIPASENWLAPNRASAIDGRLDGDTIVPADTINPGEIGVFSFSLKGIPNPGQFQEYFNPVVEGVGWMNNIGMWYKVGVPQPGYHYGYAGQANPGTVALSRNTTNASLDIRNTGQETWQVGGNVRLGTDRIRDRQSGFASSDWIAPNRLSTIDTNATTPGKTTIDPGEVARFSFGMTNQNIPDGSYPEYVRPVVDGVGWMPEDYGAYLPVTVQSAAKDYQVVSQTFSQTPANLRAGQTPTATLAVRNLGHDTWQVGGPNPISLGTARPNDRLSGFSLLSGSDPWPSQNRASRIDGKVTGLNPLTAVGTTDIKQGEIALFTVPMKVPAVPFGLYNEYFNLVQEGGGWFPDYGIFFPLQVNP